jgi:hypothetical protein
MRNNEALFALQHSDSMSAQFNLSVLNNELDMHNGVLDFNSHSLSQNLLNTIDYSDAIHAQINTKLDSLAGIYQNIYTQNSTKKDSVVGSLLKTYGSSERLLDLKNSYYNKTLASWVLTKREPKQIIFDGKRYIQKKHPIFKMPTNKWGRAHFYAPYKMLGNKEISTPIFNMLVIWVMTIGMFFTLYFSVIRRMIEYFEKFKLRRLYAKLQKMST